MEEGLSGYGTGIEWIWKINRLGMDRVDMEEGSSGDGSGKEWRLEVGMNGD